MFALDAADEDSFVWGGLELYTSLDEEYIDGASDIDDAAVAEPGALE
jgi:hypothetical protein